MKNLHWIVACVAAFVAIAGFVVVTLVPEPQQRALMSAVWGEAKPAIAEKKFNEGGEVIFVSDGSERSFELLAKLGMPASFQLATKAYPLKKGQAILLTTNEKNLTQISAVRVNDRDAALWEMDSFEDEYAPPFSSEMTMEEVYAVKRPVDKKFDDDGVTVGGVIDYLLSIQRPASSDNQILAKAN